MEMTKSIYQMERVLKFAEELCDNHDMRVTISESGKGGLIAGCSAIIGGLLMGRVGLAAGSAIGGAIAMALSESFKPVSTIIREMTPEKRKKLYNSLMEVLETIYDGNLMTTLVLAKGSEIISSKIMEKISIFIKNQTEYKQVSYN